MKITRIRIPAEFRTDDTRTRTAVADFQLGVGPCGKEVTRLEHKLSENGTFYQVIQVTADGETKLFLYPSANITGRIEVTHA